MPNFNWFVHCVEDKMDVSQDFTDSPRIWGLDLSLTGDGVALPLHHGGVFTLKGIAPYRVYYLAGT